LDLLRGRLLQKVEKCDMLVQLSAVKMTLHLQKKE
jgi:hypothetical protein